MISVLVADHHPVVREQLAEAIADARLVLAGEAGDGTEAVLMAEAKCPSSVVIDAALPLLDGAAVLKRLRERGLPIRVVLLSGHADIVQLRNALRYRPDLAVADGHQRELCMR